MAFFQVGADLVQCAGTVFVLHDEMLGRIYPGFVQFAHNIPRNGVYFVNAGNIFSFYLHAHGVKPVRGKNVHIRPAHTEIAGNKFHFIAVILDFNQQSAQLRACHFHAFFKVHAQFAVTVRGAQVVNAGHGGHHNHVIARKQGGCGFQTQFVYMVIDGGIFFNIGVRLRDIRFRLVIIIIRNKIFHRIFGKKVFKLGIQLGGQYFVGG